MGILIRMGILNGILNCWSLRDPGFVVQNGEMSFGLPATILNSGPVLHVQDLSIDLLLAPNVWCRVIDNVSFQIERGSAVGLCGKSGCEEFFSQRADSGAPR